jgi:predicted aspartyl protease
MTAMTTSRFGPSALISVSILALASIAGNPARATEVPLTMWTGTTHYEVQVKVNGWEMPFTLDTGADLIQLNRVMVRDMINANLLPSRRGPDGSLVVDPSVRVGTVTLFTAEGGLHKAQVIMLRDVAIGDRVVHNVEAVIGPLGCPLSLGQNFLRRLGAYTINNRRRVLMLQ